MKYLKEYNSYLIKEEKIFNLIGNMVHIGPICIKYGIKNYTINNDGSVDVNGDVYLESRNLKNLPLNFNKVTGYFNCYSNMLTSLKGCPKEIGGHFICSFNKLTSLEGCPKEVGGNFCCSSNQLTSLEGCPKEVGGDFECSYNQIISLEGCPQEIGGHFDCGVNKLTSLKGCPSEVDGGFICSSNQLTSLEGCPKEVGGDFYCRGNQLPKLIIDNIEYIKGIIKWQDDYSIWRKDGSLDVFRFNDMMIDVKNDL